MILSFHSLSRGSWEVRGIDFLTALAQIKNELEEIHYHSSVFHYEILDKFTEYEDIHIRIEACYGKTWVNNDKGFHVHSYQYHFVIKDEVI